MLVNEYGVSEMVIDHCIGQELEKDSKAFRE